MAKRRKDDWLGDWTREDKLWADVMADPTEKAKEWVGSDPWPDKDKR